MINDTGGHGQQPQNSTRPHAHENVADKTCMDSKPSAKVMICQIPLLILHPQRRLGRKKNCVDLSEEYSYFVSKRNYLIVAMHLPQPVSHTSYQTNPHRTVPISRYQHSRTVYVLGISIYLYKNYSLDMICYVDLNSKITFVFLL